MDSITKQFYEFLEKQKKVSCPESEKGRATIVLNKDYGKIITDLRSKPGNGYVLWISHSQIPIYAKKYKNNPDYFIDNNIREIEIVDDLTYVRMNLRESKRLSISYTEPPRSSLEQMIIT